MSFDELSYEELTEKSIEKSDRFGRCFICRGTTKYKDFCSDLYVCCEACLKEELKWLEQNEDVEEESFVGKMRSYY
jgi:hypothetical protein